MVFLRLRTTNRRSVRPCRLSCRFISALGTICSARRLRKLLLCSGTMPVLAPRGDLNHQLAAFGSIVWPRTAVSGLHPVHSSCPTLRLEPSFGRKGRKRKHRLARSPGALRKQLADLSQISRKARYTAKCRSGSRIEADFTEVK